MSTNWHLYYSEGAQPYPQSFVPANYLPSYPSSWQHPDFLSSSSPSAGAADLAQPVNHDYPATSHYPDPSQQLPPHIDASPPSTHPYSSNSHRSPSSLPADYEIAESFQAQVQDHQYAQVVSDATEPSHIHPTGSSQGSSDDISASSLPYPPPSPSPSHPAVKVEPNDAEGCFIIENPPTPCTGDPPSAIDSASVLPATVPLRASQASNEMRKMMTIFRVNPFSIQGGSKGGQPGNGFGEACPLEEEPLVFEFQVNLEDEALPEQHPSGADEDERPNPGPKRELSELRAFSPQFELENAHTPPPTYPIAVDACDAPGKEPEPASDWEDTDYSGQSDVTTSSSGSAPQPTHTPGAGRFVYTPGEDPTPYGVRKSQSPMQVCPSQQYLPSWDVAEPERYCPSSSDADDDAFSPSPSRAVGVVGVKAQQPMEVVYPVPLRAQRLHTATSHPYLRKSLLQAQVAASSSSMSSPPPHISSSPRQSPMYAPYPHPQVASSVVHHHHHHHAPVEAQQPSTKHSQAHTPPYPTSLPSSIHPQAASSDYQMDSLPHHDAHIGAYRCHHECESAVAEGNVEKFEVASGHTFYHAQPPQFYAAQPNPPRRWSLPETNVSQGHTTAGPFIPSS